MMTMRMRIAGAAAALCVSAGAMAAFPQGVSSGDVTTAGAVLWARTTVAGTVRFEWSTDPAFGTIAGFADVAVTDTTVPAKTTVTGLAAGVQHYFRATEQVAGGATAGGRFKTLAPAGERRGLRFGVSGDWRGELSPYPAVSNAPARGLDFFVKFGDTIYADFPSPAVPAAQCMTVQDFRAKHAEVYSQRFGLNAWADIQAATPIYSMIDDHEVADNFAGGAPIASDPRFSGTGRISESALYANGLQAFHEYNAIESLTWSGTGDPRVDGKPMLYRSRRYGLDAAMHMVDARTFRDQELTDVSNPLDPNQVLGFLIAAFNPARTMLGAAQVARLKADLLAAKNDGVTWQFVLVPEPVQNLGVLAAADRFEGYAAERTDLFRFIRDNDIRNVVFVAADIHGTLINNLTYQNGPGQPQVPLRAFEVTTNAVAFDAPFGPTVAGLAALLNIPGSLPLATYLALPPAQQEAYIAGLSNSQINALGYDPLGLQNSPVRATLLAGTYTDTNTYGWCEFNIDQSSRELTVTCWGVPFYNETALLANPAAIVGLTPQVITQFKVTPVPLANCPGDANGDGKVDAVDLNLILSQFGQTGPALTGDTDLNNRVNFADLNAALTRYGVVCP